MYDSYVPNSQNAKQAIELKFFTKPYIPWKLSCDNGDISRAQITEYNTQVQSNPQEDWSNTGTNDIVTFSLALGGIVMSFMSLCELKKGNKFLASLLIIFLILVGQIVLISLQIGDLNSLSEKNEQNYQTITMLEEISTCSDSYVGIDTSDVASETDDVQDRIETSLILDYALLALLSLQVILAAIWQFAICRTVAVHE
jgi:uncharacterized membrane protein